MCIMGNGNDPPARPPAYHPGNFLMKNMNPTNSGLTTHYTEKNDTAREPRYGTILWLQ